MRSGDIDTSSISSTALAALGVEARSRFSLLLYHRGGARRALLSPGDERVVGRSPSADIVIDDPSLSRQHARLIAGTGSVTVMDLGSHNGTWIGKERVTQVVLHRGQELRLGSVTVTFASSEGPDGAALDGDDRIAELIEIEATRARYFGRTFAVILVRAATREGGQLSRWHPRVEALLRPVDRMAALGEDSAEILLPEADEAHARALAESISARVSDGPALLCGIALFPHTATSAEELLACAREAGRAATPDTPMRIAAGGSRVVPRAELPRTAVVEAPAMKHVWEMAMRLSRSNIPVLLQGETGTGKEVIARAIHEHGPRLPHPLVAVNCGAIPGQLLESTLFGHEKGAFTGATQQAKGVFEAAHGGTVLLDEIAELPLAAQAALLRVLETKKVVRVGTTKEIPVDVRVIAATHRELEALSQTGAFRTDLLYRLNGFTLAIPPLRERREEIPALAQRFLRESPEAGSISTIDAAALKVLASYAWPGNVRELRNTIERAIVVARGSSLTVDDLPERVRGASRSEPAESRVSQSAAPPRVLELRDALKEHEARIILEALDSCGHNQAEAAKRLSIPLRTLVHKIRALGIKRRYDIPER